jgi:hypothetical protein
MILENKKEQDESNAIITRLMMMMMMMMMKMPKELVMKRYFNGYVAKDGVEDAKFVVIVGRLSCTWYMRKW